MVVYTLSFYNDGYVRGGEWYLEKRGSRKIFAGSRNLGSVFDKSRSLVFAWFVFTFFESRNFLPKSLGLGFLTRISASRILPFATPYVGSSASFGRKKLLDGKHPVALTFSKIRLDIMRSTKAAKIQGVAFPRQLLSMVTFV